MTSTEITTHLEYDASDPHAPKTRTNVRQTFVHLVKGYIGPGCLSQPWAYTQLGIKYGVLATVILGYLTSMNSMMVLRHKVRYGAEIQGNPTYSDVGELAYGKWFKLYVVLSVCVQQLAICTVYFSFISDNIAAVAEEWELPIVLQNQRFIMACVFPFVIALVYIKDLRRLAPITAIGTVFLFVAFGFLGVAAFENWDLDNEGVFSAPAEIQLSKVPLATCAIMYSYEGICLIFPIQGAMKEPEKFDKVFYAAMVCVCFIFAAFASFCVIAFGEINDGSITAYLMSNIDDYNWQFCILAANTFVSLCVLLTYPLQMFPAVEIISKIDWFGTKNLRRKDGLVALPTSDEEEMTTLNDSEEIPSSASNDSSDHSPLQEGIPTSSLSGNGHYGAIGNDDARCYTDLLRDRCSDECDSASMTMRSALVLLTFTIALSVPDVQELISLAGALSGSSVALIIPPLMELRFCTHREGKSYLSWAAIKCYLLVVVGLSYGAIGTIVAANEIIYDQ